MAHEQVTLNLLESVEDDADKNQQRRATIELGELCIYPKQTDDSRKNGDDGKEDGSRKGNLGEDTFKVFSSLLPRFYTRYEAAIFFSCRRPSGWDLLL